MGTRYLACRHHRAGGHHAVEEAVSTDLLDRCPFCGGKAWIAETEDQTMHRHFVAKCHDCHAMVSWFDKEDEAVAAWNRRAAETPPTLDALLSQAREALTSVRAHAHYAPVTEVLIEKAIEAIDAYLGGKP